MSKRKYQKGKQVTSLDEFFEHDFFIVGITEKTYSAGWCRSWQLQTARMYVKNGYAYVAEPITKMEDLHT